MHLCPTNPKAFNNRKYRKDFQICPSLQRWKKLWCDKDDKNRCNQEINQDKTSKCHLPEATWLRSECRLFSWRAQPQNASSQT